MKQIISIDGNKISTEEEFHIEISKALKFPDYYGKNLDALWDCLTGYIDTNINLIWSNHQFSKTSLGKKFDVIKSIFDDLCDEEQCFSFELR